MTPLPKSLLLPIDDHKDTLRPIDFLVNLYPRKDHINLLLSYLLPSLAPVYKQKPISPAMAEKKHEHLIAREEKTRQALDRAKKVLIDQGFAEEIIIEHIQEKELSVAHHSCRLADIKKVDAVVLQKRFSSRLEAFLQGDISSALLNHCLISPVWFVDGEVNISKAAICLEDDEATLRAVDHAAFMLAETGAQIELLHLSRNLPRAIRCQAAQPSDEWTQWQAKSPSIRARFDQSLTVLEQEGISPDRIHLSVLPSKGKIAAEILRHCQANQIGIVVLGHKGSTGTWRFLKNSVTKTLLAEATNLAVWVNQ